MKHILQKYFSDEEIEIINQNELEFSEVNLVKWKERIINEHKVTPDHAEFMIEVCLENMLVKAIKKQSYGTKNYF